MKKLFKGYYNPNEDLLGEMWKSDDCLFIFDTNVLLNFYQYDIKTKDEFLELIKKIKDKVWLPHQVALEYQRNRLDVVKNERNVFARIDHATEGFINSLNTKVLKECNVKTKLPDLYDQINKFIEDFKELAAKFKNDTITPHLALKPEVRQHDSVRDVIDDVFENRVGPEFEQAELDKIYELGTTRYENKIPPGFKDIKDKQGKEYRFNDKKYISMYGDLILWKQILNKTKNDNIKKVIFVTGDVKDDWWYSIDNKTIGPLEELQTEFYRETEAEHFKMYTPDEFLTDAKKYIDAKISQEAIQDVKKTSTEILAQHIKPLLAENAKKLMYDAIETSNKYMIKNVEKNISVVDEELLNQMLTDLKIQHQLQEQNVNELLSSNIYRWYRKNNKNIQKDQDDEGQDDDDLDEDSKD